MKIPVVGKPEETPTDSARAHSPAPEPAGAAASVEPCRNTA